MEVSCESDCTPPKGHRHGSGKSHKHHLAQPQNPVMDLDDDSDIEQGDTQQPTSTPKELYEEFRSRYQQTFFDFTVRMKEKHNMLPNSVADRVTDDVQGLMESFQRNIYDIIMKQLAISNDPNSLDFIFEDEDIFALMNQASKSVGAIGNILYSKYPLCEPIEMLLGHKVNGKKMSDITFLL